MTENCMKVLWLVEIILMFVNDTLLFCKYDDNMVGPLVQTIALLEWISGLKVNWEKPTIVGINVDNS